MGLEKELSFSSKLISVAWNGKVKAHQKNHIQHRTILVNLDPNHDVLLEDANGVLYPLRPWRSTIVINVTIKEAESILLIEMNGAVLNDGKDGCKKLTELPGWKHLSELMPAFPKNIGLWKSEQDHIGLVSFDESAKLRQPSLKARQGDYEVKLNLWYSPAGTDCGIHNHASDAFLEIHTQLFGLGAMQKFTEQSADTMYEDVLMAEGFTHTPFAYDYDTEASKFVYPWHRYWAETDCVWLAIEFHPVK